MNHVRAGAAHAGKDIVLILLEKPGGILNESIHIFQKIVEFNPSPDEFHSIAGHRNRHLDIVQRLFLFAVHRVEECSFTIKERIGRIKFERLVEVSFRLLALFLLHGDEPAVIRNRRMLRIQLRLLVQFGKSRVIVPVFVKIKERGMNHFPDIVPNHEIAPGAFICLEKILKPFRIFILRVTDRPENQQTVGIVPVTGNAFDLFRGIVKEHFVAEPETRQRDLSLLQAAVRGNPVILRGGNAVLLHPLPQIIHVGKVKRGLQIVPVGFFLQCIESLFQKFGSLLRVLCFRRLVINLFSGFPYLLNRLLPRLRLFLRCRGRAGGADTQRKKCAACK